MKLINDENIDEIMFQLLEGEITGDDRDMLLQAIYADTNYLDLWKTWQNTILPNEELEFNTSKLKRRKSRIIPLYIRYAAAAILIFGLIIILNRDSSKQEEFVLLPPKIKTFKNPLPQMHKDTFFNSQFVKDTFVPLKEKVKFMVDTKTGTVSPFAIKSNIDSIKPIHYFVNQVNENDSLPDAKSKMPEQNLTKDSKDEIFVTVSTDEAQKSTTEKQSKTSLLSRFLGKSSIKIEPDFHTRTKRKIIFENKKYQIIAGF
jgi:hypothetical protein